MTTKEASELSGFSPRKVRRLISDGKIEAQKEERQWNISKASLEEFLEKEGKEKKDNKKEKKEEDKKMDEKKEKDLLDEELDWKKKIRQIKWLDDLDHRKEKSDEAETAETAMKKNDLDMNAMFEYRIKKDLVAGLSETTPKPSKEEKDNMLEKIMLWQMVQQNSQKPSMTVDKPSSDEIELLKREFQVQRENEALKQELTNLRQEVSELKASKRDVDFGDFEEKLRSFQSEKPKDWAGILTGAGSVLSSLLQAVPMLRSEGISLTEIGDLVDRLTERKQQATPDNFGGNELMNNVVGLISSLAKQKQGQRGKQQQFAGSGGVEGQQQAQQKQFAGTERQQQVSEATTVDQLALALTGAVKASKSPDSVLKAIHSMLPYISEQHIPIIENLMNQLNPTWTETVVEALEDELNVEFDEEEAEETVVEETSSSTRQSRRFEGSTEHDLNLEG